MKHYLLFVFLLVCTHIQSQNYIKTLEENKTWKLSEHVGMGVINKPIYHVSCDTLMNGFQYYKLWHNSQVEGYLREDTIAQRIYFMTKDFAQEVLTVDYTLNPGDTFVYTYSFNSNGSNGTITDTVSHLDTILIDQVPHKRIHFFHIGNTVGPDLVFTEGLGDRFTGVAHIHPALTNQSSLLEVYSDSTITCGLLSSIDQLENSPYQINLYPNPVQHLLHIDISTKIITDAYTLNVTNVAGQIVESKSIRANTDAIDVSNLTRGVYFVHILNENRTVSVLKFIKE